VGNARRNMAMARFCKVYHSCLLAGISMRETVQLASVAAHSGVIRQAGVQLAAVAESGQALGPQLMKEGAFPKAFARSYSTGEEAGTLDKDLASWSKLFQSDAESSVKTLAAIIPKMLYFFILGFVAWKVVGFYGGYYSSLEQIGEWETWSKRNTRCPMKGTGCRWKRDWENVGLPTTAATTAAAATAITAAATAAFVATATAATTITAAAAAISTTTAAAITAAATTTWAGLFRLGSIHAESTTVVVVIVESLDGCIQLGLITEGHEGKSLGLPGFTVGDDFDPFDSCLLYTSDAADDM
jgi:hypothetical protein